jgi:hypothetical protein
MEGLLPPGDNFTNDFYEWNKDDIIITLSTTTFYREKPDAKSIVDYNKKYNKYYVIKLYFENDKIIKIINEKFKHEQNNKQKYLKQQINNDTAKF